MNEFEVVLVQEEMRKSGIEHYTIQQGNNCIWVHYGVIHAYYIFREGKIVDVQFD